MSLSNEEVVKRWMEQKPNRGRHGRVYWTPSEDSHLYGDGMKLCSLGGIIAVLLEGADGFLLKNGDANVGVFRGGWGKREDHKRLVQGKKGFTVPFSALTAANVDPSLIKREDILDTTEAQTIYLLRSKETGKFYKARSHSQARKWGGEWAYKNTTNTPEESRFWHQNWADSPEGIAPATYAGAIGMETRDVRENGGYIEWDDSSLLFDDSGVGQFTQMNDEKDKPYTSGAWHILESGLFKVGERLYLSSLDENRYFLSLLAEDALRSGVSTVKEAFESLKPMTVHLAEQNGDEVVRQGEWFFIKRFDDLAHSEDYPLEGSLAVDNNPTPQAGQRTWNSRKKVWETTMSHQIPGMPLVHPRRDALLGESYEAIIWGSGNLHVPEKQVLWTPGKGMRQVTITRQEGEVMLVSRTVKHLTMRGVDTGEHRDLYLEGWWQAVPNTEQRSWSAGGRVD